MRLGLAAIALLAFAIVIGCGRSGAPFADELEIATPDAPFPTPTDAPASPTPTPLPFCDAADPGLLACFRFEGAVSDGSSNGRTPILANTAFGAGVEGSALLFSAATAFVFPDANDLDPPRQTFEMWVNPASLPGAGLRYGIMDKDGQYGLFLQPNGSAYCACGASVATTPAAVIAVDDWTHVACVLGTGGLLAYVDGSNVASAPGCVPTTGGSGVYIGENGTAGNDQFLGRIDRLRITARPRTAIELCEEAGTCSSLTAP